ncbi:MAG TPA: hypothetical protein VFU73_07835 [Actinocrinis sp.]|nr:hypothetical protein [Actinocrinis sp.]
MIFGAALGGVTAGLSQGGRSVLVRDGDGAVAVMHCLDFGTIANLAFQRTYPYEAAALAEVDPDRIAAPRSYVVDAGGWIVAGVRAHVTGVSLAAVLASQPRGLDVITATTAVKDVLAALAAVHRLRIAHHGLTVDRVIARPDGGCVLIDVALAPRADGRSWEDDIAADLYAVSALFTACVGGQHPLGGLLTGAALAHIPAEDRAFSVLVELESAVADVFEAGWDAVGRDRLAALVDAVSVDPTFGGTVRGTPGGAATAA